MWRTLGRTDCKNRLMYKKKKKKKVFCLFTEYQSFMRTRKQKVKTKEKREVRSRVDNNPASLKNRQIARTRVSMLT